MIGHYIYSKDGNTIILDEDGLMQSWQDSRADNVDSSHPLKLNIYLPAEVMSIHKAILLFSLEKFRAYETGAASGGATTSGASSTNSSGSSSSSSSGASTTSTTGGYTINGDTNETSGNNWAVSEDYGITEVMSYKSNHNHGFPNGTGFKDVNGITHWWAESGGHAHGLCPHKHSINIGSHSHGMDHFHNIQHTHNIEHTHNIGSHTHNLSFGIYESISATGVTIKINGIDRTSALGGPWNSNQNNIDIKPFLRINQWNVVELGSGQLGRIDSSIFIQAFVGGY